MNISGELLSDRPALICRGWSHTGCRYLYMWPLQWFVRLRWLHIWITGRGKTGRKTKCGGKIFLVKNVADIMLRAPNLGVSTILYRFSGSVIRALRDCHLRGVLSAKRDAMGSRGGTSDRKAESRIWDCHLLGVYPAKRDCDGDPGGGNLQKEKDCPARMPGQPYFLNRLSKASFFAIKK